MEGWPEETIPDKVREAATEISQAVDHQWWGAFEDIPLAVLSNMSLFISMLKAGAFLMFGFIPVSPGEMPIDINSMWEDLSYILPFDWYVSEDPYDLRAHGDIQYYPWNVNTKEISLYRMVETTILFMAEQAQLSVKDAAISLAWISGMACPAIHGLFLSAHHSPAGSILSYVDYLSKLTPIQVGAWTREECRRSLLPRYLIPIVPSKVRVSAFCQSLASLKASDSYKNYILSLKTIFDQTYSYPTAWRALDDAIQLSEGAQFVWSAATVENIPYHVITDDHIHLLIQRGVKGKNDDILYSCTPQVVVSIRMILEAWARNSPSVSIRLETYGR